MCHLIGLCRPFLRRNFGTLSLADAFKLKDLHGTMLLPATSKPAQHALVRTLLRTGYIREARSPHKKDRNKNHDFSGAPHFNRATPLNGCFFCKRAEETFGYTLQALKGQLVCNSFVHGSAANSDDRAAAWAEAEENLEAHRPKLFIFRVYGFSTHTRTSLGLRFRVWGLLGVSHTHKKVC